MAIAASDYPQSILTSAAAPASLNTPGTLGTPLTGDATRVVLLGAGELGKELAIELQRLGVEVTAVGSRDAEPAMQVAHRSHVVDLLDSDALLNVLAIERPHIVVPEAGVIEPSVLGEIEDGGARVVPSALTTQLTMNREILRRLLAEDLKLPTPDYQFAGSYPELLTALEKVGLPAVVKPVRSAGGAGHSVVREVAEAQTAWQSAVNGGWFSSDDDADLEPRVIVEEYVPYDAELVVFVVRARESETLLVCPVIQVTDDGGFTSAWQPATVDAAIIEQAKELAQAAVSALPGLGVFAVELFVVGDRVLISEVTPRLVSAGFVTLASQQPSVFEMQTRATLGLPVCAPVINGCAAARAIWVEGSGKPVFSGIQAALASPGVKVLLFGKPKATRRRMVGMVITNGNSIDETRALADLAASNIQISLDDGRVSDATLEAEL